MSAGHGEAEQESRSGYEILTKQTEPSVSRLESARGDLVAAYAALRQPEKARSIRAAMTDGTAPGTGP